MNSRTVHNLSEHLTWLLRSKPFIPPTFTGQIPDPIPQPARGEAIHSFSREALQPDGHAFESSTPKNEPKIEFPSQQPIAEEHEVKKHSQDSEIKASIADASEMARLRAAPSEGSDVVLTPLHLSGKIDRPSTLRISIHAAGY